MINFTSGLIRTPLSGNGNTNIKTYINPEKIVSFSNDANTTIIEYTNGKFCELEDIPADAFANAFSRAKRSEGIVDVII